MPDSKSAQSLSFFVILESKNFLGFRNIYPEIYDPSWFFQLFLFSLNSFLFVSLITRNRFCKKVMQNEMIMFLHKRTSLCDFVNFLCQKAMFFIIDSRSEGASIFAQKKSVIFSCSGLFKEGTRSCKRHQIYRKWQFFQAKFW